MPYSFYKSNWFIVLLLFIFPPIGLFLLWKYSFFHKKSKILLTGVTFLFLAQLAIYFLPNTNIYLYAFHAVIILATVYFYLQTNKHSVKKQENNAKKYIETAISFLETATFTNEEKNSLKILAYNLDAQQKNKIDEEILTEYIQTFIAEDKLNPKFVPLINSATKLLGQKNIANIIDNQQLHIYTTNWLISEKKQLQQYPIASTGLILEIGEHVLWSEDASFNKYQFDDINTPPPQSAISLTITKGMCYPPGSIAVTKTKHPNLVTVDTGKIYFTDRKIFLKARRINLSINISNITYLEITENGLTISTINNQIPYYIDIEKYEFPCTLLSFILDNPNFEIAPPNFAHIKTKANI